MKELTCTWYGTPVSANQRLAPGRGRNYGFHLNPGYLAFKADLARCLRAERKTFGDHPVRVFLTCDIPKRMDVDAVVKPCLDALQMAGVIDNDGQVESVTVEKTKRIAKPHRVVFRVEEIGKGKP